MEKRDINWIFNLKIEIPKFLKELKGKKRKGFYHYSLTGDYFGENIKWGLGNSVFFLKVIYTLKLETEYQVEIKKAINYIKSFQKKNGLIYDPLIWILSTPLRIKSALLNKDLSNLFNQKTIRGETRQAISSLIMFNEYSNLSSLYLPITEMDLNNFLTKLPWNNPWSAGAHFSYLLFMLNNSSLSNKNILIKYAIDWVNKLQHEQDGFWYQGNPPLELKINGAMKVITGLKAVNNLKFNFPEKIVDNSLMAINDPHACDNFNIVYTLKYCNELLKGKYRYNEIEDFLYDRLRIYKDFYHSKKFGFSFFKNQANRYYYDALITRGKNEPDIHGTVLFLWGISVIAQTLNLNKELQFREFIT